MNGQSAVQFNRISSNEQEDGFSLDAQEQLGMEYAKRHGLRVVHAWSEVESAYKEQERKKFFQMVEYVKKHEIRNVIFDKVDRAVRGFRSAVVVEDLVEMNGVRFHFTRDNLIIDATSSPQDKFRFYLFAIMGKYYVDNLKQEQKKGVNQRLEQGHWSWGCPPGYRYEVCPKSGRSVIGVDPKTAPAIQEIYEKFATGNYSLSELIGVLNGVSDRQYGWKRLCHVIQNPFYYGAMEVKGKVLPAAHKPIIEKKLWDACQKMRGIRSRLYLRNPQRQMVEKPFMRLLHCGECGHVVTGESHAKKNNKRYVYYRCANVDCPQRRKTVSQESLHVQIVEAFRPFSSFTSKVCGDLKRMLVGKMSDIRLASSEKTSAYSHEVKTLKSNMAKLRRLYESGHIDATEYSELVAARTDLIAEFESNNASARSAEGTTREQIERIIELLPLLSKFFRLSQDLASQAEIAKMLLSNRFLKDGIMQFRYINPFDVYIEFGGMSRMAVPPGIEPRTDL